MFKESVSEAAAAAAASHKSATLVPPMSCRRRRRVSSGSSRRGGGPGSKSICWQKIALTIHSCEWRCRCFLSIHQTATTDSLGREKPCPCFYHFLPSLCFPFTPLILFLVTRELLSLSPLFSRSFFPSNCSVLLHLTYGLLP